MIALALIAQLSVQTLQPAPSPFTGVRVGDHAIIRDIASQRKACPWSERIETSFEPAALYRHGDRDPHVLRRWIDYPEGTVCKVAGAQ